MIAPEDAPGSSELEAVTGVACSLIAAEAWSGSPAVFAGVGPQLRIYCLHGEDAIVGEDSNEDSIAWSPTDGDWHLTVPCPPEDVEWVRDALAAKTERVTVSEDVVKLSASLETSPQVEIDPAGFLKP